MFSQENAGSSHVIQILYVYFLTLKLTFFYPHRDTRYQLKYGKVVGYSLIYWYD